MEARFKWQVLRSDELCVCLIGVRFLGMYPLISKIGFKRRILMRPMIEKAGQPWMKTCSLWIIRDLTTMPARRFHPIKVTVF